MWGRFLFLIALFAFLPFPLLSLFLSYSFTSTGLARAGHKHTHTQQTHTHTPNTHSHTHTHAYTHKHAGMPARMHALWLTSSPARARASVELSSRTVGEYSTATCCERKQIILCCCMPRVPKIRTTFLCYKLCGSFWRRLRNAQSRLNTLDFRNWSRPFPRSPLVKAFNYTRPAFRD